MGNAAMIWMEVVGGVGGVGGGGGEMWEKWDFVVS
jgi:hypothetical protein